MAERNGSARRMLSIACMVLGALLLLLVPTMLVVLAFAHSSNVNLPGTLVIVTAAGGMTLVAVGAALRD